jgi:hypothetical protein
MALTKRRQLVGFVEQTNVYNHLRNCTELVKSPNSGISYCQYRGDWTDAKVGEKFGYTGLQIRDFRRKHIGRENPGSPGKPHSRMAMLKRIEALETRVALLEESLGMAESNVAQIR